MSDLTAGKASAGTSILRRLMFSAISKSAFFRQSGWMLFATTLSGVFFYAVHFFAGRKMDPDEYGAFNALLQVLTQMAIPSVGLLTIFVQQAALAESEAHRRELAGAVRSVLKATFFFWLATATLVFVFQSRLLADYKIQNPVALWATVALGLVSLWTPVMQGILQGRQNFLWLGMIPIVSAFTRLVLVAVIVTMLASALFSTGQVKDPSRLAEKLCAAADPVSRCLWDRFSAEAQRTLKSPESAPGRLEPVLNEGLNRILRGPSLFEPERFAGVRLSKESRLRLTQSLEGEELVRLNRRLMEDAYPHEIGVNPLRARQAAGAMLGVLFSMMAALGLGVWQTLPLWRGAAAGFCWTPWLKRVLPLTLGMGSTTFMFTIDMLAVQRFLPESGIYGAAGMIGRALVFLVAPLTMVMFPKIVRAAAKAERTDVLMQALGATALLAGCAAVFCTFWPDLPIRIVQGEKYLAAAPLVRWFAWCIIPLMVSTVLVNNLMARERYAAVPWLGAVAALYAFALWQPACHASPVRVIQTLGSFALIYFGVCLFFTWKQKRVGSPDPLPAGAP